MDVTIEIQDTTIIVTVSDENGYNPDVIDDALRRAGEQALLVYREIHPKKRS